MLKLSLSLLDHQDIDLQGELPPSFLEVENNEMMSFKDQIKYDLHASKISGGVLVKGTIETMIDAECGRCLKKYRERVANDNICLFYEDPSVEELDITEDIRAEIVICLPVNCICSPDCKGFCLKCGADLSKTTCTCDEEPDEDSPWSALDNLDLD
jgi:uncharacterized protein